jgi:predicted nucleic acid-binding protein
LNRIGGDFAIVDTGPLFASIDAGDAAHQRSLDVLRRPDLHLVIPALVVAETTYLAGEYLGPTAEAAFLAGLARFDVQAPFPEDWSRIADLVAQYADLPLGGTDASVIALAERLNTDLIITLDLRHFRAVRPRHGDAFRLLPADV